MKNIRRGVSAALAMALFICFVVAGMTGAVESTGQSPLKGYPVLVAGREVFQIKVGVGSFTAQERAAAISKRLDQISSSTFSSIDSPFVAQEGNQFNVLFGDIVLVSVTEADAAEMGRSQESLARYYADEIGAALIQAKNDFSPQGELLNTFYSLLSLAAMVEAILLLRLFTRRAEAKLMSWRGTLIRNGPIQNFVCEAYDGNRKEPVCRRENAG